MLEDIALYISMRWRSMLFLGLCFCSSNYSLSLSKSKDSNTNNNVKENTKLYYRNLYGKPGDGYYIEVHVGTPPQVLNVLIDTGSSNFAIAAAPHKDITTYFNVSKSTTVINEDKTVYVPYTQGNWKGDLKSDIVSFATFPNISVRANLACIFSSDQFFINGSQWQGILGLAYKDIARPDSSVEPFFDSLFYQSNIRDIFSMQLCGTVNYNNDTDMSMGGTLLIGGVDKKLYIGNISYAMLIKEWYYEVILTDVTIGGISLNIDCKELNFDKTIVDSGTTNLRLPTKVFELVTNLIKSQTKLINKSVPEQFWSGDEILCWERESMPWNSFPIITLALAESRNTTFNLHLSPQQYLRAVGRTQVDELHDDCFKFAIAPSDTGTVLGAVVMEGFYVIFDRESERIGFAQTTCQSRDDKAYLSRVDAPVFSSKVSNCPYKKHRTIHPKAMIVGYVMAGLCGFGLLFVLVMYMYGQCLDCRKNFQLMSDHQIFIDEDDDET